MKILFLCGSLEPGRDGVGDYTRRLAAELIRQGHEAAAIAFNDRHVADESDGEQFSEGFQLPVLRIPSSWSSKNRYTLVEEWIGLFNPTWISLQFVPFAFHQKGLHYGLGRKLSFIGSDRNWHIMFHELWVGMDENSSWKHCFWGKLQKGLILSLLTDLNPKITHTQTKLYQAYLNQAGIPTQHLPLFSNIPRINSSTTAKVKEENRSPSGISMVIFGGIFPGTPVEMFSEEAGRFSKETGVTITLKIAGRNGAEQRKWLFHWMSHGLPIENLGERSEEELSEIFSSSHFGISTTPLALIEKSGSVAAMLAHNLPIISVAKPWKPTLKIDIEAYKGVVEYQPGNFRHCIRNKEISQSHSLSLVARQFSQSLDTH